MSTVDKNKAIIDYLIQCPQILDSPLYFNLIDAQDDNIQIITRSEDKATSKEYVDGSVAKRYTFSLIVFKSISDLEVIKDIQPTPTTDTDTSGTGGGFDPTNYPNENVDDLAQAQALIDWIDEQNDYRNFPDFGDMCYVDEIQTTTDTPQFNGINTELSPPLAMYSITIEVNYIDKSKMITI